MKTIFASMIILTLAVGCQNNKKTEPSANAAAMDASPPPPAQVTSTPAAQPVVYDTAQQAAPAPSDAASAASSSTGAAKQYTVRKGDTLWRIAQTEYGSGKSWQKIVDANPGLSPTSLRAGQKIVIP